MTRPVRHIVSRQKNSRKHEGLPQNTRFAAVPFTLWLYVNSWGRGKKGKIESRVGEKAPARFLSIAEEDSVSEIAEVTHSEADPFQNFGLLIAAFSKPIRPRDIHRIEDLVKPVAI